jgi:threonine dehydrogenase-like Zn-dependent dehydrogenase
VGILAAHCAQHRGARRVILIDNVAYRLQHAQQRLPGLEVINFKEKDTFKALK